MDRFAATGPLAGVTVLDHSTVGPATRCTSLLADYGARVVKIAPVPGRGPQGNRPAAWAYGGLRGMRRARLDVRHDGGRRAFLALAAAADVVVESFRPGVADRLGIGWPAVEAVNPGAVYCAISGYGQHGPRAGWAGHDVDYLAVGGYLASCSPGADGCPPLPGATVADAAAGGMQAALAVLGALHARHASGAGTYLDVSVADGVLWLMSLQADEHLATGVGPGPGHDVLTGRYACYATYAAADGRHLAVGAIEPRFFANLCRALGVEEWAERQYDDDAQPALRAALAEAFARRSRDDWVAELAGADTCVAPVLTVAEAVAAAPDAVADTGSSRQLAPLLAGMPRPAGPPELLHPDASQTCELLADAGMTHDDIAALVDAGVVA